MFVRPILVALCGCMLLFACNTSTKTEDANQPKLTHGKPEVNTFGACDTVTNHGASVIIDLWQPSDSGRAARKISAILAQKGIQLVNSYADSASIAANPAAVRSIGGAFEVFQKNYKDFRKEVPDAPGCWQIELKGDTVMVTSKVFFYQLNHFSFTGGAHPNSFQSYHAFDGGTGEEMEMKDFIADSVALLSLVEKKFRKIENLAPTADLEEAGYFLANHHFFMPANYVFTAEGLSFYYNPYEIAAYVRGPIEFTIPYNELKGLVKTEKVF